MTAAPDKANQIGHPDAPTKQMYLPAPAQHKGDEVDTTSPSPMRCSSRQLRNGLILANVIGWMIIAHLIWLLRS